MHSLAVGWEGRTGSVFGSRHNGTCMAAVQSGPGFTIRPWSLLRLSRDLIRMRSSSSSINSAGAAASSATGGRDPSVAASSAAPSRPASQQASQPSSSVPLQSMSQSRGSRGTYVPSQTVQSQAPSASMSPRTTTSALSGSGSWRNSLRPGGGGSAGAGSALAPSLPASLPGTSPTGPSQASSGRWRLSLGSGSARPSTSGAPQTGEPSRAPPSQGSVVTAMYADLASRAASVQQSINQHEAAGHLTPEHAATLRDRYSFLEESNSDIGTWAAQSAALRAELSARSGTNPPNLSLRPMVSSCMRGSDAA